MAKSDPMIETVLKSIDGVEFVKTVNRYTAYSKMAHGMYTTYKIAGGVMYRFNDRTIILPDGDDNGYEVILDERINEFVTDGSSELFDILIFLTL